MPSRDRDSYSMDSSLRSKSAIIIILLLAGSLGGCGTINGYLATGASDLLPGWAGGLPEGAPPRPGTLKYDEYVREQEARRNAPAVKKGDDRNSELSSANAIH